MKLNQQKMAIIKEKIHKLLEQNNYSQSAKILSEMKEGQRSSVEFCQNCSRVKEEDCKKKEHNITTLSKDDLRSPSATDTVSSQQSQISTITTNEEINLSIEKTYLETSFEFSPLTAHQSKEEAENAINAAGTKKAVAVAPPTLPKPRPLSSNQDIILSSDNLSNSLDKKIRNCTQV